MFRIIKQQEMFVVASKRFFKLFTSKWVTGIALYPFIVLRYPELKQNKIIINHEKIHIRQQVELLVIGFYLWYLIEYLFRLIQYKDHLKAYANISFEREAYTNQGDYNYVEKRRFWSFLKYL